MPQRIEAHDPSRPLYLDPSAVEAPEVAIGNATREALRMVDVLQEMLQSLGRLLGEQTDKQRIVETRRIEDILDRLNTAIRSYLVGLDRSH